MSKINHCAQYKKIVMGGEADVKLGAIAQFDGVKSGSDTVRLERIVILTGNRKSAISPHLPGSLAQWFGCVYP